MKQFSIAKSNFIFPYGRIMMPINAVYGKFTSHYYTTRNVIDKKGNTHKRRISHEVPVVYYVTDFRPYKVTNSRGIKKLHYCIHVYDIKRDKWTHDVLTSTNSIYYELADYLTHCFALAKITPDRKVIYGCDDKTVLPHEKKSQVISDSVWRVPNIGYVLNNRVITSGHNGWVDYKNSGGATSAQV